MRKREDSPASLGSPTLTEDWAPPRGLAWSLDNAPAFSSSPFAAQAAHSLHAEAGGFEPPIPLRVYRISSAAHSATLARFLTRIVAREDFTIVNQKPAFYKGIIYENGLPKKREPDAAIVTRTFFSQENEILCRGRCAPGCL